MTQTTTNGETTTKTADPAQSAALARVEQEERESIQALDIGRSRLMAAEPRTFDEVMRVCELVASVKMFGVKSPAEAFVRIATGMSLGLSAMHSLNGIDAIPDKDGNPRPSLRAKLKVGLCLRSPMCEYFRCVYTDGKKATYVTKRRGQPEQTYTYTIEMAQTAGYADKLNWKQNPDAMLRARASSFLADMVFPDVTGGLTSTEEALDHAYTANAEAGPWETVSEKRLEPKKVDELRERLLGCASAEDVDAVSKAIVDAVKAKDISDEDRASLKKTKEEVLKAIASNANPKTGEIRPGGAP